jgi:electron-transferring-flavoprotein dehydrogenase
MLAAETAFDAMVQQNFSLEILESFQSRVDKSWIKEELWTVRNFHQGFEKGFLSGMVHAGLQQFTGGRGLHAHYNNEAGHRRMQQLHRLRKDGGAEANIIGPAKGDGKLTFDKLTDLYHSGTKHEEDQPSHLVIHDTTICNERCVTEFGNPCKNFCPANVYEMVEAQDTPSGLEIHLNPSNCVHCKTCDIMDPYEIITWVPPEGGGGPNYEGM